MIRPTHYLMKRKYPETRLVHVVQRRNTSLVVSESAKMVEPPPAHSMISRRTATWARPRNSDDGYSSDSVLRHASSDFKKMGRRVYVFIVGGATRSELRVCHKLTSDCNTHPS
ncbi:Sec1-like protein [Artemisia annua]|uniref:Sec1-like protein n=1 Tax=Artemisia annua TaxID=35608 RepID=A0A2U1L083_ARTAN|nr:Sec1-like protein [Artemisia annua]